MLHFYQFADDTNIYEADSINNLETVINKELTGYR